ncbi:polygalacturonase inhibitor-like [Triticum dicoccoides]|uniref:polygalacturonase inhibitor-like n=1 Tax=Triticum dicoccoides TaxID=85692 RepID=UPI001890FAF8|nr:polygalacturonase inhibitor-like [Triticum dicoccoides]
MSTPPSAHAFLVLLLLVLAGAVIASAENNKDCHPSDKATLLAVKSAFGNQSHFASWTPSTPCCDWHDITCNDADRVIILLFFEDVNLTGTIPDAISGLTELLVLNLYYLPAISGPIPKGIAKLSKLTSLSISLTSVSGPIPSFLGALTKLNDLTLSSNSLTGTIPASLAGLRYLDTIDLRNNRLTGTIPPLFYNSKSPIISYLLLSNNHLSGSIPTEFAAVGFQFIDLSHNALTGDASVFFGRTKELESINLSHNALSFDLSSVEFPEEMQAMDASYNAIRGGIPAQVANVTNLRQFNVSYNKLCGQVPAALARLDVYNFQHNKCLCGAPLPDPCKK